MSVSDSARRSFGIRLFLCLSVLVLLSQAVSLYHRGSRGGTDIGVFYRTTQMLKKGAGGEVYTQEDARTGWPIAIPPAGLSIFQPLSYLSHATSTILWALLNLGLAAASLLILYRCFEALEQKRRLHSRIFPWAAGIFLILASASIQVGQYSLLFAACWIFALYATITQRSYLSGLCWALPSAIKIYPVLLLAAPLSGARTIRDGVRILVWFAVGFGVASLLLPLPFYGLRTGELNIAFWQNAILGPESRASEMQTLGSRAANQSLDAILLRYLHHDPDFHSRYPYIPHLNYSSEFVLQIANLVRAMILIITIGAVVIWMRNGYRTSPYNLLMMAALWSATLYLMLPETRGRYAVYTFLAFLPLLSVAVSEKVRGKHLYYMFRCAIIAVCLVLVMSLMPRSLRAFGLGFIGPLVLWIENIRLTLFRRSSAVNKR